MRRVRNVCAGKLAQALPKTQNVVMLIIFKQGMYEQCIFQEAGIVKPMGLSCLSRHVKANGVTCEPMLCTCGTVFKSQVLVLRCPRNSREEENPLNM